MQYTILYTTYYGFGLGGGVGLGLGVDLGVGVVLGCGVGLGIGVVGFGLHILSYF